MPQFTQGVYEARELALTACRPRRQQPSPQASSA